jgi:hypothetical protein
MNPPCLTPNVLRAQTIELIDQMVAAADSFQLPPLTETCRACLEKLRQNQYLVLVVGEVKRGKSSFINAILGRDLLPTNVGVTTAQVFRIRSAKTEAYRIRFEDDSFREIQVDELARYGSQVEADSGELPKLEQIIRWIEVEVPVRFLPPEIVLLDTPGLGSLYAAHSRITGRFVPRADAVVFTLGSDSPISTTEIEFLKDILDVTPNIFFIQTMIDRYKGDDWRAIQGRNYRILAKELGEKLFDPTIYPISNSNLMKAAETGDPDYENVSRFPALSAALQKFLYRVAGRVQMVQALVLSHEYQKSGAEMLASRRKALVEESATERAARLARIENQKRELKLSWGENGAKKKLLLETIHKINKSAQQGYQQLLSSNGPLFHEFAGPIHALGDLSAARQMAETLADRVLHRVEKTWRDVRLAIEAQCQKTLQPFLSEVNTTIDPSVESVVIAGRMGMVQTDKVGSLVAGLKEGGTFLSMAATGTYIATAIVPAIATSVLFTPLAVAGLIGVGLYGLFRGSKRSLAGQLKEAKRELEKYLDDIFGRVNAAYFSPDFSAGKIVSEVAAYFEQLNQLMTDYVTRAVIEKTAQTEAEIAHLTADAALDETHRQQQADRYAQQIEAWSKFSKRIEILGAEVVTLLENVDRPA